VDPLGLGPQRWKDGMTRDRLRIRRALGAWAVASYRRPGLFLLLGAVLVVVAGAVSAGIDFDSDIMLLLPRDRPSVQQLHNYREANGGLGAHVLMIRSPDPASNRDLANALAALLRTDDRVERVELGDPVDLVGDRALYYLSLKELRSLRDQVKRMSAYHRRKHNPLLVSFDESTEKPPEIDYPDPVEVGWKRRYEARDGRIVAVVVWPKGLPSDMQFVRDFLARLDRYVERARKEAEAPGAVVTHHGSYFENLHDYLEIESDILFAPLLSLALLLVVLGIALRSTRAIICVLIPLAAGIAVATAVARISFGQLNNLSAFFASVLLGLGVDFGLHWLMDFQRNQKELGSDEEAVRQTTMRRGYPLLASALTSAVAFFSLCLADNRGFREFGFIAGVGVLICLAATFTWLPALAAKVGVGRIKALRSVRLTRSRGLRLVAPAGVLAACIGVGLLVHDPDLFEYRLMEYSNLYHTDEYRDSNDALREVFPYLFSPIILVTPPGQPSDGRRVREALAPLHGPADTLVVIDQSTLVPGLQEKKRVLMRRMARSLRRVDPEELNAEDRRNFKKGLRLLAAKPFGMDVFPGWLRRMLVLPDGRQIVLAYSSLCLSDGHVAIRIRDSLEPLIQEGWVPTGEVILYAELLQAMKRDGRIYLLAALLAVVALLRLFYGRWRSMLQVVVSVSIGMLWMVLAVRLLGEKFGLFNMVTLPLLAGIGMDDNLHLLEEIQAGGRTCLEALRRMWWPIIFATLTTLCGFIGFLVSSNPGLRSVGVLGAIGFFMTLAAALFFFPALINRNAESQQ
jgi:predicted RND superfamily exporter protein